MIHPWGGFMSFLHRVPFAVAVSMLLLAGSARAVTFDFGEALFSNFDTLQIDGVTFTANPAGFADYGEWFPFDAEFVQGAALQIDPNASVALEFSQPLSFLTFGAAIGDTGGDLTALASIQVFDSDGHQVLPVSTDEPSGGLGVGERKFTYFDTSLKRAIFKYSPLGQSVLAVDNMTITPVPVPEPETWVLILVGCALLATRRARAMF
jgi:hypothetical protein